MSHRHDCKGAQYRLVPLDGAPAVQEGDLAAAIKRIPAIAESRRSLAESLRAIRRMNRPVAKHVLQGILRDREKAAQDWNASLDNDVPLEHLMLEMLGALLIRFSDPNNGPEHNERQVAHAALDEELTSAYQR